MIKNMTTDKEEAIQTWFNALLSGEFNQGDSYLCQDIGDGEKAYCCIGVLDEVVLGTEWHKANEESLVFSDDVGEAELVDTNRVKFLDLHLFMNEDERDYFADHGMPITGDVTRIGVLSALNDIGWTFEMIVDAMIELGWDA